MRLLHRKHLRWVPLAAMAVVGVGCSGINASKSVSPLDFLLPGSSLFHLQNNPPPAPPGTNDLLAATPPAQRLALAH